MQLSCLPWLHTWVMIQCQSITICSNQCSRYLFGQSVLMKTGLNQYQQILISTTEVKHVFLWLLLYCTVATLYWNDQFLSKQHGISVRQFGHTDSGFLFYPTRTLCWIHIFFGGYEFAENLHVSSQFCILKFWIK